MLTELLFFKDTLVFFSFFNGLFFNWALFGDRVFSGDKLFYDFLDRFFLASGETLLSFGEGDFLSLVCVWLILMFISLSDCAEILMFLLDY